MSTFIGNVDLETLIRALWQNAHCAPFFDFHPDIQPPSVIDENELQTGMYVTKGFDYLSGRTMKFKLTEDKMINTSRYDAQGAHFTFQDIVMALERFNSQEVQKNRKSFLYK